MGKIATEDFAYNIGNEGLAVTNKCCTKTRAKVLGCRIASGYYEDNQLVQENDLAKDVDHVNLRLLVVSQYNSNLGYIGKEIRIGSQLIFYDSVNRQVQETVNLGGNIPENPQNLQLYTLYSGTLYLNNLLIIHDQIVNVPTSPFPEQGDGFYMLYMKFSNFTVDFSGHTGRISLSSYVEEYNNNNIGTFNNNGVVTITPDYDEFVTGIIYNINSNDNWLLLDVYSLN